MCIRDRKHIDHVSTLPFSSSVNQSQSAQQLVRTTNSSLSSILRLCDERNSESLRSYTWISWREFPLRRSFERAITPDKPTTSPLTTLMDKMFGQISRSLRDGASGPEAFALLLRLLSGHFVRGDSRAGYRRLHIFRVENGTPFCDFNRESGVVVSPATGTERALAPGLILVWRWFGWQ